MKYRSVEWSREARDFVPVAPRPRRFLNFFENVVGLVLFAVGFVLFVAFCHLAHNMSFISLVRSIP